MTTTKIKSVLDFKPKVEAFIITNPENGEDFEIMLRPLTYTEISSISAKVKRPKPKEIGFKGKDELGRPIPIFDDDSPEFKMATAKANEEFVNLWLIAAWDVEIPGETVEEKMAVLRENIPNWVFLELQRKLNEIQGFRMSDVAYEKKKSKKAQLDSSNMKSASDTAGG